MGSYVVTCIDRLAFLYEGLIKFYTPGWTAKAIYKIRQVRLLPCLKA